MTLRWPPCNLFKCCRSRISSYATWLRHEKERLVGLASGGQGRGTRWLAEGRRGKGGGWRWCWVELNPSKAFHQCIVATKTCYEHRTAANGQHAGSVRHPASTKAIFVTSEMSTFLYKNNTNSINKPKFVTLQFCKKKWRKQFSWQAKCLHFCRRTTQFHFIKKLLYSYSCYYQKNVLCLE